MCNANFNPRLAPVTAMQAKELKSLYPAQSSFIEDVYKAMTDGLAPQTNLLVMFTLLRHQYQQRAQGILTEHKLLYVPLSIVAKTGEQLWTRFRPQAVKELHTSFLSFMMAETNRNAVNAVCGKYRLAFGQGHCCGVLFGTPDAIKAYQQSELYRKRNFLRSAIESLAMPVEEVSFEEISENNIDLGIAEREFFELYEEACQKLSLPACRHDIPEHFMERIDGTWENVLSVTPAIELLHA
jgi:hypothetical protein